MVILYYMNFVDLSKLSIYFIDIDYTNPDTGTVSRQCGYYEDCDH